MGFFEKKILLDIAAGYGKLSGPSVVISKGSKPGYLRFRIALKADIEYQIKGIAWQEDYERSAGKTAAGAIIGGALTGGIGLIAGAAIGAKRKDTSTAVIAIVDNNVECALYVRCNGKQYAELTGLLQS